MGAGRAAVAARVLRRIAVGVGLLAVGLSVAALVLRWPLMGDFTVSKRLAVALTVTLAVPNAL